MIIVFSIITLQLAPSIRSGMVLLHILYMIINITYHIQYWLKTRVSLWGFSVTLTPLFRVSVTSHLASSCIPQMWKKLRWHYLDVDQTRPTFSTWLSTLRSQSNWMLSNRVRLSYYGCYQDNIGKHKWSVIMNDVRKLMNTYIIVVPNWYWIIGLSWHLML